MEPKPLPKENNLLRKLGLETILRQFVRSIATTVSHSITNVLRGWLSNKK